MGVPSSASACSTVNFTAVTDSENKDQKLAVPDFTNQAVITYSITPKTAKLSGQCMTEAARFDRTAQAFFAVPENLLLRLAIKFEQLFASGLAEAINPPHASFP